MVLVLNKFCNLVWKLELVAFMDYIVDFILVPLNWISALSGGVQVDPYAQILTEYF